MSNRYSVLRCDIDDPNSIESVGTMVRERALKGACSYFELQTRLAARIVIECNPAFGSKVQILDDEEIIGEVMSSNSGVWHRYLKVERAACEMPKGLIAHKILSIINAIEFQIPEETVRGYDMILFYIREGYVPDSKDPHYEGLESKLVEYLRFKPVIREPKRRLLPHISPLRSSFLFLKKSLIYCG